MSSVPIKHVKLRSWFLCTPNPETQRPSCFHLSQHLTPLTHPSRTLLFSLIVTLSWIISQLLCDFPLSFWNSRDKCHGERRSLNSAPAVSWAPSLTESSWSSQHLTPSGMCRLVSAGLNPRQAQDAPSPSLIPPPSQGSTCLKPVLPYPLSQNCPSQRPHLHWIPMTDPILLGLEGEQNLPPQKMFFGILIILNWLFSRNKRLQEKHFTLPGSLKKH